jgi:predicted nucleic acid-binding protein
VTSSGTAVIGYLDTSVFVPLLVAEPTSESCQRFWDDADAVVSSRLLYVETAAALAQAQRMDRLTGDQHDEAIRLLDRLWSEIDIAEVDEVVVTRAAVLARRFALRGYDAVHCASAEQLDDEDVVAASGHQQLLSAWAELGMVTFDSNALPKPVVDEASGEDDATA